MSRTIRAEEVGVALPDFLVIGAPKAGTTALHAGLASHPEIFMTPVKEPRFFLCDDGVPPPRRGGPGDPQTYQEYVWRRRDYEALFAPGEGRVKGESSPFYLWDRKAHHRIRALAPHMKLVAVLRDPVERAYSNWAHLWSAGLDPCSDFLAACAREPERVAAGWAPFWRYLDLGRYGEQLRDLRTVFPSEQVLLLRYRDVRHEPTATLRLVCAFLGVSTDVLTVIPEENVRAHVRPTQSARVVQGVLRAGAAVGSRFPLAIRQVARAPLLAALQRQGRPREPLTAEQRAHLLGEFAADTALLEELTGLDFSDWRRPDAAVEGGLLHARALPA
jgi:Sulfotransferase family